MCGGPGAGKSLAPTRNVPHFTPHLPTPQKGPVWQWSSEQGKVSQIKLGKRSRGPIMKDSLGRVKDFEKIQIGGRMIIIPKLSSFSHLGMPFGLCSIAFSYRLISFFV